MRDAAEIMKQKAKTREIRGLPTGPKSPKKAKGDGKGEKGKDGG